MTRRLQVVGSSLGTTPPVVGPPVICRRPACAHEVPSSAGAPGRPSAYCSSTCRTRAHRERKQAEAALRHWQAVVRQFGADTTGLPYVGVSESDAVIDSAAALIMRVSLLRAELKARPIDKRLEDAVAALAVAAQRLQDAMEAAAGRP